MGLAQSSFVVGAKNVLRPWYLRALKMRVRTLGAGQWSAVSATALEQDDRAVSFECDDSDWGYQIRSHPLTIPANHAVVVSFSGSIEGGGLSLGLLDSSGQNWISNQTLYEGLQEEILVFECGETDGATLVFSNVQQGMPRAHFDKLEISIQPTRLLVGMRTQGGLIARELEHILDNARPVPMPIDEVPTKSKPFAGKGLYLRTDYWVNIQAGGSYGHTCYVAEQLNERTESFQCLMANKFDMLDDMGLSQEGMEAPFETCNEMDVLRASLHYVDLLREKLRNDPPDFIYERHVLGNYAGAKISQELNIPYILEYNGSEVSMKRSFDENGYEFEDLFLQVELAACRQATLVVVVSQIIADQLIERGIDARKVLVNPNGCSPEVYKPVGDREKEEIRRELKLSLDHVLVGFIGTFGGWHGIDVLADSLHLLCQQNPNARFLLIGDGNFAHLVREVVSSHGLADRVLMTGSVPQHEGARLLSACDIYVSPHSRHMVDSKFFGSPTKIFEYMALGGGIVASNLEQIGEVLSPAFHADSLQESNIEVGNERSVLCRAGDVSEFVRGVGILIKNPDVARKLGTNARQALIDNYSWEQHVVHIWERLVSLSRDRHVL